MTHRHRIGSRAGAFWRSPSCWWPRRLDLLVFQIMTQGARAMGMGPQRFRRCRRCDGQLLQPAGVAGSRTTGVDRRLDPDARRVTSGRQPLPGQRNDRALPKQSFFLPTVYAVAMTKDLSFGFGSYALRPRGPLANPESSRALRAAHHVSPTGFSDRFISQNAVIGRPI